MIAARRTIRAALAAGVEVLTLYAFSQENWRRPRAEISALMGGLELHLRRGVYRSLRRDGVELRVLGDLSRLGPRTRSLLEEVSTATAGAGRLRLNLALSYGARAEITRAARRLAEQVKAGTLDPDRIDEECFAGHLYTDGIPDPDLLIRTSGECRVSNFLLWQIAYTELYLTPVLWPDFTEAHFFRAIRDYGSRERRFGRVTLPSATEVAR